jgi:serine/threonine protein kinase
MDKYNGMKTIGDGTYGSVVKAMNMKTGTPNFKTVPIGEIVAIKKMKKKYFKWDSCVSQKEIQSLMKLSHPNIVQLYEVILEKNVLHFVFEYLDMNVYQLMKERRKLFSEHQIRNIMFQTIQGLASMHKHNYFHRDLKPENLLCYH